LVEYKKRLTRKLWHYKKLKGCAECGYNKHGLALDFAHIDPSQKSHWMYKNGPVGSGMGVLVSRIPKYGSKLHKDRMKELKDEIKNVKFYVKIVMSLKHIIAEKCTKVIHYGNKDKV
jgi:hypothetical protein